MRKWMTAATLLALSATGEARDFEYVSFPPGFQWCVGTAAHQFEGGNFASDWWAWEQIPGKIKNGDTSRLATDHWNRYEEDLDLAQGLNVSTFRFSIEWAKIEPREGEWDRSAVAHYREVLASLKRRGMKPWVSIHHMTLPKWFADRGGFGWEGAPHAFGRYARFVYEEIGLEIEDWSTSVDAAIHLLLGHSTDKLPPGLQGSPQSLVKPIAGFLRSHAAAYHAIHSAARSAGRHVRVGITHHLRIFDPASRFNPLDVIGAKLYDFFFNWLLSDSIKTGRLKLTIPFVMEADERIPGLKGAQDFIAMAYYTRSHVSIRLDGTAAEIIERSLITPPGLPVSDLGWEIYPEGMYRILRKTARRYPGTPIFIAENGLADESDAKRRKYFEDYLREVKRAIDDGVPVTGYCAWALTDNFEWLEGYGPRFGIFGVDFQNGQRRFERPSASFIREVALWNGYFRQSDGISQRKGP